MNKRMLIPVTLGLLCFVNSMKAAEKMSVIIIDHQNYNGSYRYVVPCYSTQPSNAAGALTGARNNALYRGAGSGSKANALGATESYLVTGATLTLKLPDNRVVVVNCSYKTNWFFAGSRSCRLPPINKIEAEFFRDMARLAWPVSIDGDKYQKETYRILAVFDETENSDK